MEILVIRHGESEADLLEVHEGRADFPLTHLGVSQAERMASYIKRNYQPDLILSSPLIRASKAAEILQSATGCELIFVKELMEYNNGILAGMSREEASRKYPLPKGGRPIHIPIQEGESDLEFFHRVESVFHRIIHEYGNLNRIAIVSHGGFISNFLKIFLGLSSTDKSVFSTGDTGIHLVEIRENRRVIKFMNSTAHLL